MAFRLTPKLLALSLPLAFLLSGLAQEAAAQPEQQPPAPESNSGRSVSLTFSPIHLALPVGEISAEFRLAPNMAISGIFGAGKLETTDSSQLEHDITVFEIGAQFRYYLTGGFESGFHVGGELLYLGAKTADDEQITADAAGLAVGPLIGYKWTASFGLVLEAQGGAQFVTARSEASNGSGSAMAEQSDYIPLINLNAGFAF